MSAQSPLSLIEELIKKHNVEFVDFRFTDFKGKWHHTTQHVSTLESGILKDGVFFDGSSLTGWKGIHESDMLIMPDLTTASIDPFTNQPTLVLTCDVIDPNSNKAYNRDPRSVAKKALSYLKKTGIGDQVYFGPEAEFFIFDDVRWGIDAHQSFYITDSDENPINSRAELPMGNKGHRPLSKGGYFPVAPVDSGHDIRSEMVSMMKSMNIPVEKHHHEVAPAQHEIGITFADMVTAADYIQIYKYCVHMVAHTYGKTATFMPKPIFGDNGSGMHCHQSIWKDGKNIFAGDKYANLSDDALYYMGGIIKHAKALNAFTNPSTNSYKRLVPGYEAPVLLAYSSSNRSASIRIPFASSDKARRIEVRFPDPTANPYLAFTAMLMAGIDGIKNKIDPGHAFEKNLFSSEEKYNIPTVASSLTEALNALDNDRAFLIEGDVMSNDMIDSYITIKEDEAKRLEITPHPIEFEMYYSV